MMADTKNASNNELKTSENQPDRDAEFFANIFLNSPVGIFIVQDGKFRFVNPEFQKIAGYDEKELLGGNAFMVILPEDRDMVRENAAKMLKGELFSPYVYRAVNKDGDIRWIIETVTSIRYGGRRATLGYFMDNTERERAKEALRLSEEKFHKAFRSSPDPVVISTLEDGFYIDVNDAFLRNTGYERKEVIGHSSLELGIWANPDHRAKMIKILREQGAVRNFEARFRMKSGKIRFVLWSAEVIDYGDEKCLIAVTRDITNRKRAEKALRERTADLIESEEKYRTLVENVPLVVYRMKPSGEILFVNQFVEEAFGYSPTEIFRNPTLWNEKVYDEDRVKVEKLREKSFLEGEEFIAEYRVKHKNGSIVYAVDHAIPFEAAGGLISSIDGIMMDVTGKVKLQEKLVQAEGLKTISEVSARLAHEIRNPLVSAGGFARRLLSSMSPDDPNRAKVDIIVKEVGRLETILRMMLNYIQPLELDKSPTELNQLVERALSAVDMEIKERNVRIDLQLSQGLPDIRVDRPQMELVVETLAKQALNQMQEGATLSISTFQEDEMLKLVVRYPVQHMSSDDVEHFFYPFTTSQMAHDTADLPMSKIVVDKHGGVIDVSLTESGELIIHISLPL